MLYYRLKFVLVYRAKDYFLSDSWNEKCSNEEIDTYSILVNVNMKAR